MNAKFGLRKLKEQQSKKKIDHPLAKYSSLGQLSCAVCNLPLKSDLLWLPHLQSKKHKEAVAELKSKGTSSGKSSDTKSSKADEVSKSFSAKRKHDQVSASSEDVQKKTKGDSESRIIENNGILPADFFDQTSSTVSQSSSQAKSEEASVVSNNLNETQESASSASNSSKKISELLPEGFFDDAKMDAKARKVEYVDKKEEEWEEFQKMIATETKVSEDLQAEEEEESKVEKDLSEYTALKQYVARVTKLKQLHEKMNVVPKKHTEDVNVDGNDSDSEDQIDDILNWRAKKA